jgi:hypothetical protein
MDFQLNKVYSFVTRAPSLLGASIINAKLVGIMIAETARKTHNVDMQYRKIFPLLPPNTPDDIESCVFYEFIGQSGDRVIYADQWIDMTSVEIVDHIRIVTTVVNASLNDVGRIRDVLNAMGYRDFTVEVTTP